MANLVVLQNIELVPVVELEPMKFATREHSLPSGTGPDMPGEWRRYWLGCLEDAGITGLEPLPPCSWQVPVRQLTNSTRLHKLFTVIFADWGGPDIFTDRDSKPVLNGGLALFAEDEEIARPGCCSDLGNLSDWEQAVAYRGADWQMLWIGHPWLSVRYEAPWLVMSKPHESGTPTGHWAVNSGDLDDAIAEAVAELDAFAVRLQPVLEAMGVPDVERTARRLVGLET